jgi:hypothetical protein
MIDNLEEIEKIRNYVATLREKVKILESRIKEYQSFNGNEEAKSNEVPYDLQQVLNLAARFFS